MMATANACTFCKKRKRKCDKARPACSNCTRLRKTCEYSEDAIRTPFPSKAETNNARPDTALPALNPWNSTTFPRAVLDFSMSVLGSYENLHAITNEFFITTHQRIPILSRHRFYSCILEVSSLPRADLAALSLCIYLVQQMPGETTSKNMRSSLYVHVKSLIGLLEMADNFTIDLLHCKILLIYYELGHGFHTSAYLSLAAAAKMARIMGIHEKPWQTKAGQGLESMFLEEQKRAWWAIVNLDRFISLCHGETLLATEDPEISDILPIEDLLWSEGSQEELAALIAAAPSLDTPSNVTLGQMARECQISHIIGRLTRHMSNPTLDPEFNREECHQLERTLRAYVPLLAEEELKMGKYCGAFAMCNNALFILYDFKLNKSDEANYEERWRILQSMEDVSLRSIAFAELSFSERIGSTLYEVHSPYCPYSLFQAAVVQYRLWKQTNDLDCKLRVDSLKSILQEFAKRWSDSSRYLDALEKLEGDWPSMTVLPQRAFH